MALWRCVVTLPRRDLHYTRKGGFGSRQAGGGVHKGPQRTWRCSVAASGSVADKPPDWLTEASDRQVACPQCSGPSPSAITCSQPPMARGDRWRHRCRRFHLTVTPASAIFPSAHSTRLCGTINPKVLIDLQLPQDSHCYESRLASRF